MTGAPVVTAAYGTGPDQVIDFHLPEGADAAAVADAADTTAPCVVLVHGGYWRQRYDRGYLAPAAAELARHGMPVALVEYRRVGGAGGWPRTGEDVVAALAAARAHPAAAGRPLVVVGHSAGGQLALWAAARHLRPPDRVVAVGPVADLGRAHELGLSAGAVAELFGGADRVAGLLAEADPVRLPPAGVPVAVLHGTADEDVPVELSHRYVTAAAAHPLPPLLRELDGADHFAPLTPGTAAFAEVLEAIGGTP